jgi:hypothetical protein
MDEDELQLDDELLVPGPVAAAHSSAFVPPSQLMLGKENEVAAAERSLSLAPVLSTPAPGSVRFPGPLGRGGEGPGKRPRLNDINAHSGDADSFAGCAAWQTALAHLQAPPHGATPLEYCVQWIRLEGYWRRCPLLLARLEQLGDAHHDCAVTLCDPTGSIDAVLHRHLFQTRQADLEPGAVLLLRNCTVFTQAGLHYLNVVEDSLVLLFPPAPSQSSPPLAPDGSRGSYRRIPTRLKRPSSSSASRAPPKPRAATGPPRRSPPGLSVPPLALPAAPPLQIPAAVVVPQNVLPMVPARPKPQIAILPVPSSQWENDDAMLLDLDIDSMVEAASRGK